MNLPVEGAFHNLVLVSIKKQYPFHAARARARALGLGADDLLEGHLRRRRRRRRAGRRRRSRGACSRTSIRSATSPSSTGPIDQLDHGANQALWGSKVCIDGTRKWTRGGLHARVAGAVPHERRRRRRASTRCGRSSGSTPSRARRRHANGARDGGAIERGARRGARACCARRASLGRAAERPSPTSARAAAHEGAHGDAARAHVRPHRADLRHAQPRSCRRASTGAGARARSPSCAGAPPGPVLDLCAGTLDLTALLAGARPGRAHRRGRLLAGDARARPPQGAARRDASWPTRLALPFDDGDVRRRHLRLRHAQPRRPGAGAREARRVLRPGGVFVTLELFRPTRAGDARVPPGLRARRAAGASAAWSPATASAYAYLAREHGGLPHARASTSASLARRRLRARARRTT